MVLACSSRLDMAWGGCIRRWRVGGGSVVCWCCGRGLENFSRDLRKDVFQPPVVYDNWGEVWGARGALGVNLDQ